MAEILLTPPSTGAITQYYGNGSERGIHSGNDYAYSSGGKIHSTAMAMDDGVVIWADDTRKLGWPNKFYFNPDFDRSDNVDHSAGIATVLEHWYGWTTYCHLEETTLNIGDRVRRGAYVGTVGQTGFSYGKHLHAELILNDHDFNTNTGGRADLNLYMVDSVVDSQPAIIEKDWFDMATAKELEEIVEKVVARQLEDFKPGIGGVQKAGRSYIQHMANVDSALSNPTLLDKMALAVLKRPINLIDPSAKTGKVVGTTTLATKGNWEAYNFQKGLNFLVEIAEALKLGVSKPQAVTESTVACLPEDKK